MKHTEKRFLSMLLVLIMVTAMFPAAVFAENSAQTIATVKELEKADTTFAITFTADSVTAEQKEMYGDWYADVELVVNKDITLNSTDLANSSYLLGKYDFLNVKDWTPLPFSATEVKANEPWGIIAYMNTLPNNAIVHRFTSFCNEENGVSFAAKFTDDVLADPDFKAEAQLALYDPNNADNRIVIASYTYPEAAVELPTATTTALSKDNLTFAMNFLVDEATDKQLEAYGSWYADFELTANKDVTLNANGGADGYLSGQYDAWSTNWVNVPFENTLLKANESIKVMEFAAKMMNQPGLQLTFLDVYNDVKDFDCGLYFTESFLALNPDLEVKLELKMYNPADPTESYTIGEPHIFTLNSKLPTATVTTIKNNDLTFAMNFKADPITDAQLKTYGSWYADFELTVSEKVTFNADGSADGWLSGQYDEWSENWINVPFNGSVTLNANEPLKIMAFAAKSMNNSDLQVTCKDIYDFVKDFDCGVYFTDEYLAENPDLVVTLELKIYNNENTDESYVIGDTYIFRAAPLPTATVTDISNDVNDLTFAMNFLVDDVTENQLAIYGNWYADFELTVNKPVTMNANSTTSDGYLSGHYEGWSSSWINVPTEDVSLAAGETIKVMETAAKLLGQSGLKLTFNDVYTLVKDFDCGVFFTEEFLANNPDLVVTLELKMYNNVDPDENYVIGDTYIFRAAPLPTATVTDISNDVSDLTFALNFKADPVTDNQLAIYGNWYADFELTVSEEVTFYSGEGGDGWLSGQYDNEYTGTNWVNVPFKAPVNLKAGETIKIMAFAAESMGEPGLKYTYKEVYELVKDFNCGVYFTSQYLAENPDLVVTLELKMYNPADESVSYVIGDTHIFRAAPLPTATVTTVANKDLTFAMNFKADPVTENQLAIYGPWYADFELTVNKDVTFNANGGADGWLSGQYDEWSENWVSVPFENVTLKANKPLKIMEYAAELMGEPGLKYTYKEIYEVVKDFDCGVFFTDEYLEANPDLVVTLELKMYNPKNEDESYVIGDTYIFTLATKLPTATVTEIENKNLTFALNFVADPVTTAQLNYYGSWYADFELTINKDVTFNADSTTADGYLSGQYDDYSPNWINVPFEDVTLAANTPLKIMEYAAEMLGEPGLKYTYKEIYEIVKDFDCGVYFTPQFLAYNPDLEVRLELKMYNPTDLTENYVIGETYIFTLPDLPTATVTEITNENLTFAMNFLADPVTDKQLAYYGPWYADFELTVNKDVTFNANGGADGYLSGSYDAWQNGAWVNVPFEDVTLEANKPLKIMEYAAELLGEPGLKYTYKEVYEIVKDFDCGVYFTPEFLLKNPDLKVTLELKMYNPYDESINYVIGDTYIFTLPDLPTATVTEITNENLTFALNFVADPVTDKQLAYYGPWYADFELTVNKDVTFNANGGADGWLSGQYDEWSSNWVNVPFENVTLEANKPLKIMAYAAELMGEPGLKYTYKEVYEFVKDFDCGVFFEPKFLAANPDLEVRLELKMYNPYDENINYVIGDTYIFTLPDLPTATVTDISNDVSDLTFALNFVADPVTDKQLAFYGNWYADFELTVNLPVTFNANGDADGHLSGQYDEWSSNWVSVPFKDVTLEANKPLKIMEYAAELMGEPGLKYTYKEVYEIVKDFDCGVFFTEEFLQKNKNELVVTLELKMYNPYDESINYVIGDTYVFTLSEDIVAYNIQQKEAYTSASLALADAAEEAPETVILLRSTDDIWPIVKEFTTFDLNGYTLTTAYINSFGDIIDSSANNDGLLVVAKSRIMIQQNNVQLPVFDEEAGGYRFVEILKFNQAYLTEQNKFAFQPLFEPIAHELLLQGKESTGVTINVRVEWFRHDSELNGEGSQDFEYIDEKVNQFLNSYKPKTGKYSLMFTLVLMNSEYFDDMTCTAVVRSETGVELCSLTLPVN